MLVLAVHRDRLPISTLSSGVYVVGDRNQKAERGTYMYADSEYPCSIIKRDDGSSDACRNMQVVGVPDGMIGTGVPHAKEAGPLLNV